jgi:DNA recombination protein RmuC
VRKLQTHFVQANKDIDDILVSSNKVTKRGAKIEALEFGPPPAEEPQRPTRQPDNAPTQMRLRVVDED